jgi:hypothetical protein
LHQAAPDEALQQINHRFQQGVAWRVLRSVDGRPTWTWKPCTSAQELTAMLMGRLAIEGHAIAGIRCPFESAVLQFHRLRLGVSGYLQEQTA